MPTYLCDICGYSSSYSNDIKRHQNKKKKCIQDITESINNTISLPVSVSVSNLVNDKEIEPNVSLIETLRNENMLLKIEIEKLKAKLELKDEMIELYKSQQSTQIIPQISPQIRPQIIIQKGQNKKTGYKTIIERDFKNSLTIQEFLNNTKFPNVLKYIPPYDNEMSSAEANNAFVNVYDKVFENLILQVENSKLPFFCSDKARQIIHLFAYDIRKEDCQEVYYFDTRDEMDKAYRNFDISEKTKQRDPETKKWIGYVNKTKIVNLDTKKWNNETNNALLLDLLVYPLARKMTTQLIGLDFHNENEAQKSQILTSDIKLNLSAILEKLSNRITISNDGDGEYQYQ
jgi:regulator of replication initiation timing